MPRLIIKKARMQGFIYMDYAKSFKAGNQVLSEMLKKNLIKGNYEFHVGLDQTGVALQSL